MRGICVRVVDGRARAVFDRCRACAHHHHHRSDRARARGFRGMRAWDDARAMERDDRLTRRDGCTIQGVATLAAAKPSFAAYGESANVFGGISNPTGARDTIDIALEIDSVWVDANACE